MKIRIRYLIVAICLITAFWACGGGDLYYPETDDMVAVEKFGEIGPSELDAMMDSCLADSKCRAKWDSTLGRPVWKKSGKSSSSHKAHSSSSSAEESSSSVIETSASPELSSAESSRSSSSEEVESSSSEEPARKAPVPRNLLLPARSRTRKVPVPRSRRVPPSRLPARACRTRLRPRSGNPWCGPTTPTRGR